MIDTNFKTSADVIRQTWVQEEVSGVTVDRSAESVVDTVKGYLQSASADYAQYNALTIGKGYRFWCPLTANVVEGDILRVNNKDYKVRAVRELEFGCNQHRELALELLGTQHGTS